MYAYGESLKLVYFRKDEDVFNVFITLKQLQ